MANLLTDNFVTDPNGPVSASKWTFVTDAAEFIPATNGGPGTELEGFLPSVSNGALHLTLQTFNPTARSPGDSFYGSDIVSQQSFSAGNNNSSGIAFTVVARIDPFAVPGIVGGIFPYSLINANSHNEIDFESLSDNLPPQVSRVQTNIYLNAPTNSPGNPLLVADPTQLSTFQTYTIEWYPNEIIWLNNGQVVRTDTTHVPQGSMQLYLNAWAYDPVAPTLTTATTAAANKTYSFDVQSVSVDTISTVTISGTVADQHTSGATAISPFSGVTINDVNQGQSETVTVTSSSLANGQLSNLAGGSYNSSTGTYTVTGTPAAATVAIDGLVFTPAAQAQGGTTTFTIAVTDAAGASATDSKTTVVATIKGDPHLVTFAGTHFDFQAVGNFDLSRSTELGNAFDVQMRTSHVGHESSVSYMTAIAAAVGYGERVTWDIGRSAVVGLDGSSDPLSVGTTQQLQDGATLTHSKGNEYNLTWNSGERLVVTTHGDHLDAGIALAPTDGAGSMQGILGPNEGHSNDFMLPDGGHLLGPLTEHNIATIFADAWRVSPESSLFDERASGADAPTAAEPPDATATPPFDQHYFVGLLH